MPDSYNERLTVQMLFSFRGVRTNYYKDLFIQDDDKVDDFVRAVYQEQTTVSLPQFRLIVL